MITEGTNVVKDKGKLGISYTESLSRIDFLDRRFYKRAEGIYYPSVTTILSFMPKDRFFETWIKDVGHNADIVLQRAGKEGSQVHDAIERLLKGEELCWLDKYGNAIYSEIVWEMILRFQDFWTTYKPTLVFSEKFVYSDEHKYAGTMDLVVMLDGKKWLLDTKTSNSLHKANELQLAAYAVALKETEGIEVDNVGILWLKAFTRKTSKVKGLYQGNGWQIKPVDDVEKSFEMFQTVKKMYEMYNGHTEPIYTSYPTTVKL